MPTDLTPEPPASRVHPDDAHHLGDWWIYGPRDNRIPELVEALAQSGLRLDAIEEKIVDCLQNWKKQIEKQGERDNDRP